MLIYATLCSCNLFNTRFSNVYFLCCGFQSRSAKGLARLLELCTSREPCPNAKIVRNLCSFVCGDPAVTPSINLYVTLSIDDAPPSPSMAGMTTPAPSFSSGTGASLGLEQENTMYCDQYNGIYTLLQHQKVCSNARLVCTLSCRLGLVLLFCVCGCDCGSGSVNGSGSGSGCGCGCGCRLTSILDDIN